MGIIHSYYYMSFKESERLEKEAKAEKERQEKEAAQNKAKQNPGYKGRRVHPAQGNAVDRLPQALTALAEEIDDEGGL